MLLVSMASSPLESAPWSVPEPDWCVGCWVVGVGCGVRVCACLLINAVVSVFVMCLRLFGVLLYLMVQSIRSICLLHELVDFSKMLLMEED